MAAATQNRDGERQPSEYVPYTGASGYTYYQDTMIMEKGDGTGIAPLESGTGASGGHFLGVGSNRVDLAAGLGTSQWTLNVFKVGEHTFVANGTGASAHIGQKAYGLDDQTVGVSIGVPCFEVGEIVGVPTSSSYRVRMNNSVNTRSILSVGTSLLYSYDLN